MFEDDSMHQDFFLSPDASIPEKIMGKIMS
jgi:hypothetical protein